MVLGSQETSTRSPASTAGAPSCPRRNEHVEKSGCGTGACTPPLRGAACPPGFAELAGPDGRIPWKGRAACPADFCQPRSSFLLSPRRSWPATRPRASRSSTTTRSPRRVSRPPGASRLWSRPTAGRCSSTPVATPRCSGTTSRSSRWTRAASRRSSSRTSTATTPWGPAGWPRRRVRTSTRRTASRRTARSRPRSRRRGWCRSP